jgi:hypothetical protein
MPPRRVRRQGSREPLHVCEPIDEIDIERPRRLRRARKSGRRIGVRPSERNLAKTGSRRTRSSHDQLTRYDGHHLTSMSRIGFPVPRDSANGSNTDAPGGARPKAMTKSVTSLRPVPRFAPDTKASWTRRSPCLPCHNHRMRYDGLAAASRKNHGRTREATSWGADRAWRPAESARVRRTAPIGNGDRAEERHDWD